ncbi:MAG: HAD hydrolase-like protein [Prolixibacteraceae bacterium]|jgi:phosphoglycolate phosphatase|nr:HAD hydrolase-like protein [Prolixibacteraceae bacterium]
MSQFTHIIFDLDGTLTDNTRGIGKSLQYSLRKMQLDGYSDELLKKFIGPPLQYGFKTYFGLNEKEAGLAVGYFREYYGEYGWSDNIPYPGVHELLEELHFSGKQIFVATSKLEKFARMILQKFGLYNYLTDMQGAGYGADHSKAGLIQSLMDRNRVQPCPQVAMVGDTGFDLEGARETGISAIAVGYGFGGKEDLLVFKPDFFAEDVSELYEILI